MKSQEHYSRLQDAKIYSDSSDCQKPVSLLLLSSNQKQWMYWEESKGTSVESILAPYFAIYSDETVNMTAVRAQVLPAMKVGCEGGMCPHVSLESLEKLAKEGNIQFVNIAQVPTCRSSQKQESEIKDLRLF